MNCPVRERTADGESVGRCWHHLPDGKTCPRHGDVSSAVETFQTTGKLSEEPDDWVKRGRTCRAFRAEGPHPFRSPAALAAELGISTMEVRSMETGQSDPSVLEKFWGTAFPTAAGKVDEGGAA